MDYPALTPGTSPSGAPLINPIFLNFFSPRRAAASLSLSRRWGWRLMMMVVAAVMKPSCLASLRALKKVTLGDGGEEESRAARSAVSMFAVCVSTWARAAAPTKRHALTEGERERERDREGGRWVGVSACESYTSPALFKSIPLFSPLLALDDEKPDRREMKMKQSKGSLCASLWFYTHADLSGCEVTEQWALGPFLCRFLPKWMCLLRLVFH